MASLVKRPNNKTWYVQYKDRDGKFKRVSTKTDKKKIALDVLAKYQVEETKEYNNLPTNRSRCTLGQLKIKYLDHIQSVFSPRWYEIKKWMLENRLLPFFGEDTPLKNITQARIEAYQQERLRTVKPTPGKKKENGDSIPLENPKYISARTVNIEVHHVLLTMLRKAVDWGILPKDAMPSVKKLQEAEGRVRFLSEKEVALLLKKARTLSVEMETFVMLGIHAGLRAGESLALRWMDVNFDLRTITLAPRHDWTPKSRRTRIIPITPELYNYLFPLSREQDSKSAIVGLDYNSALRRFRRLIKLSGLQSKGEDRVLPHTLRHTFASHLVMNGTPLYTVAALLGHSDIDVTRIYAHLAPNHLQQAINGLSYGEKES